MSAPSRRNRLRGGCHCGAIEVVYETARAPADFDVRACQCDFCRKQGARNISGTDDHLTLNIAGNDAVSQYRFGTRTADFLICRTCGTYVAATCTIDGSLYGTVNINTLEARSAFPDASAPVSFDGESKTDRLARRKARWTPASLTDTGSRT